MNFSLPDAANLLSRTPATVDALLRGLPEPWLVGNEGEGTWSPVQVVAHLIEAERKNWLPRARAILEGDGVFPPFDRFGHLGGKQDRALSELLDEFHSVRAQSMATLKELNLSPVQLAMQGQHPEFGVVTLSQLLSTWVVHDQDHLMQITRTLAVQYRGAVGPWQAYLRVLKPLV